MSNQNEWKEWDGVEYDKDYYEVLLPDGSLSKPCWPNAGVLHQMDGTVVYKPSDKVKARKCSRQDH